jgi:hypothetical protein
VLVCRNLVELDVFLVLLGGVITVCSCETAGREAKQTETSQCCASGKGIYIDRIMGRYCGQETPRKTPLHGSSDGRNAMYENLRGTSRSLVSCVDLLPFLHPSTGNFQ